MANQFLNAVEYANVMLMLLKNQLVMGKLVDGQFRNEVTDINGLTINVKRPPRFARNNAALQDASLAAQDIVTGSVPITVNQYAKVHVGVGDLPYVQSFNSLMQNETMKSAASTLAHQIDSYLAGLTLGFNSWVAGNTTTGGVDATDPTKPLVSVGQANAAETRLLNQGAPISSISGIITPLDSELMRSNLLSSFTPDLNAPALERARLPVISNVNFYATQQTPAITTGTRTQGDGSSTGSQVNAANQNVNYRSVKTSNPYGQTITMTMTTGQTVKAGEVFTIAGVYAWDWRAQAKLDYLQQFTVTADATAAASAVTLSISPPIIVQGTNDGVDTNANTAFATVDSVPANNAYVQFAGAASTTLRVRSAFHKQAIALVSARLHTPFTGISAFQNDPETGIGVRYWRFSDGTSGTHYHRWDAIYGASVVDNFLGTRVCGS